MNRLVLALCLLAACGDDHGILVVVTSSDSNVSKIRLFVGTGGPTTKTLTIAGPHEISDAIYYDRDPNDRNDVVAVDGARTVKFAYVTDTDVPLVIAVGYDNASQPVSAGVLHDLAAPTGSNEFVAYQLELAAQVSVFGTSGELRLGLWSNVLDTAMDPYVADCAGIQVAGEAPYFVVSPDDQDCDGWKNSDARECTPDVYNGSIDADPRHPTCLVESDPAIPDRYCAIGGEPCQDGSGSTGSGCNATNICAPDSLCGLCGDSFACAADLAAATQNIAATPHYHCTLPAQDTTLCASAVTFERPPTGGLGCSDFRVGNMTFDHSFEHGDLKLSATGGKDATDQNGKPTSCLPTMTTDAGETGGISSFTGIAEFTLTNGAGIALPILFEIASGSCAGPGGVTCAIESDEPVAALEDRGMAQCASGWSPPTAAGVLPIRADGGATVSEAEDELIFASQGNLYRAERQGSSWGPITQLLVPLAQMRAPKLSGDGTHLLVMASSQGGSTGTGLYELTRASAGAEFSLPVEFVDPFGMIHTIESATYVPDVLGPLMVAMSTSPGSTVHLYTVGVTGHTLATSLNTVGCNGADSDVDQQPMVSYDGLHLYFQAQRGGLPPAIYVSSRPSQTAPFGRAVRIPELSGVTAKSYPSVTDGGATIYYTTTDVQNVSSLLTAKRAPL